MNQIDRAAELVAIIRRCGHDAALVGGLAVSARSRERFTKDIDFAVSVATDLEAERLAFAMQQERFRLQDLVEQEARGVIATLRFVDPRAPGSAPTVDLLCGTCGIEPEVVETATAVRFSEHVSLPVARVPHLIAMKVLSEDERRVQDRADLQALLAVAANSDLVSVRELLDLITTRGFDRGRDLQAAFRAFEQLFARKG